MRGKLVTPGPQLVHVDDKNNRMVLKDSKN
jgi:hypothetical protein